MLDVFQESILYADHAGRQDITLDDVRLAIQAKVNYSFTSPPPREVHRLVLEAAGCSMTGLLDPSRPCASPQPHAAPLAT